MPDEVRVCVDRRLSEAEVVEAAEVAISEHAGNGRRTQGLRWDERVRLALETKKMWRPGRTIRIAFLDGDPALHARVRAIASEWTEHAHLRFAFVDSAPREVRISFAGRDSSSCVGTDALRAPLAEPTMNLGGLTPDSAEEHLRRVVLHEFGHMLGCIHEHASPAGGIPWNHEAVYAYYARDPYRWSREKTDANIFAVYKEPQTQFSAFDPASIMIYPIPKAFRTDGVEVGRNTSLSKTDVDFIAGVYPKPDPAMPVLQCDAPAVHGEIAIGGAQPRFRFTVTRSGTFVVETHGHEPLALELRRADGTLSGSDPGRPAGGNARVAEVLKPGDYVAEVRHLYPEGNGPFSISLRSG